MLAIIHLYVFIVCLCLCMCSLVSALWIWDVDLFACPNPHPPPSARLPKITYFCLLVVCSYSPRVRGIQSQPGQSADGTPGLLHPAAAGSGAGTLPGRVPVGQDAGARRPDAGCADPRGRWVGCTCGTQQLRILLLLLSDLCTAPIISANKQEVL